MSKKDIFTKKDITENGEPAIFYGEISRKYDCFVEEISKINTEAYERADKISKGQILVNLEDFDCEDVGRCVLYENDTPVAINGNVAILTLKEKFKDAVNLNYITFYLNHKDVVRQYVYDKAVGEKVKRLSRLDFENMLITITTLGVQNKITDNFIELKRKFENDITELEEKIKIINENSKVYMEHIFKFN